MYHAISIQHPYIDLILSGDKRYETRKWSTKHRGVLILHAAGARGIRQPGLAYSAFVGACILKDVHSTEKLHVSQREKAVGFWTPYERLTQHSRKVETRWPFAFEIEDAFAFGAPVVWPGMLNIFAVPDSFLSLLTPKDVHRLEKMQAGWERTQKRLEEVACA